MKHLPSEKWVSLMKAHVLLLCVCLPLLGCNSPEIAVLTGRAVVGEPVKVSISNLAETAITFCADFAVEVEGEIALLPFQILRRGSDDWTTVLASFDSADLYSTMLLEPHSSETFSLTVKAPGTYKLRLCYVRGDQSSQECPLEHPAKKDSASFVVVSE